jgi:hypothetical protein
MESNGWQSHTWRARLQCRRHSQRSSHHCDYRRASVGGNRADAGRPAINRDDNTFPTDRTGADNSRPTANRSNNTCPTNRDGDRHPNVNCNGDRHPVVNCNGDRHPVVNCNGNTSPTDGNADGDFYTEQDT